MKILPMSFTAEWKSRRRLPGLVRMDHKNVGCPSRASLRPARTASSATIVGITSNLKVQWPARPSKQLLGIATRHVHDSFHGSIHWTDSMARESVPPEMALALKPFCNRMRVA